MPAPVAPSSPPPSPTSPSPPPAIARITAAVVVSQAAELFSAAAILSMKQKIALALMTSVEAITVDVSAQGASRRRLAPGGGTLLLFTIDVPRALNPTVATETLTAQLRDADTAAAFLSTPALAVSVLSVPLAPTTNALETAATWLVHNDGESRVADPRPVCCCRGRRNVPRAPVAEEAEDASAAGAIARTPTSLSPMGSSQCRSRGTRRAASDLSVGTIVEQPMQMTELSTVQGPGHSSLQGARPTHGSMCEAYDFLFILSVRWGGGNGGLL